MGAVTRISRFPGFSIFTPARLDARSGEKPCPGREPPESHAFDLVLLYFDFAQRIVYE